ncbi:MAG: DUF1491 family protein [Novosphingobium sp.]|nr:DUF1491 family protein [Novosphingobium sp.]
MRLRSDIWVAAYIRRVNASGGFAVLQRRGADEAGAIYIAVEDDDRMHDLYVPAPQSVLDDDDGDRRFRRHPESGKLDALRLSELLQRETRFDTDLWVVAVEDRERRHFLDNSIVGDAD